MSFSSTDCVCTLYKQEPDSSTWMEYNKPTSLQVSPYGLSFRIVGTYALIGDFPFNSIMKTDFFLSTNICRLRVRSGPTQDNYIVYGIKLHSTEQTRMLMEELTKHGLQCERMDEGREHECLRSSFPSLIEPEVNDYVIQLLFNNDYQLFVSSVRDYLNGFDDV